MDDLRSRILSVTITFIGLATVFVALRMISRVAIVRKFDWSDFFIIIAWVLSFGVCFILCYGTTAGLGLHAEDIPEESRQSNLQIAYAYGILYDPALMAMKTSILVFYLTLTKLKKTLRWLTYLTLFAVNAAGIGLTFLNAFRCNPPWQAFTYPRSPHNDCHRIVDVTLASVPANIMTDLAILFLPLPVLTQITLPLKQRVILLATFSAWLFVMAVGVVRIAAFEDAFLQSLSGNQYESFDPESDHTWYAAASFLWSGIEVNTGIMCACVPTLRPLVTRVLPIITREGRPKKRSQSSSQNGHGTTSPPAQASNGNMSGQQFMNENRASGENNLHTSDAIELAPVGRAHEPDTANSPGHQRKFPKHLSFGFVNIKEPRCMLSFTTKESAAPIAMIAILFFISGFAYGLLNILNERFEVLISLNHLQLDGLHAAYFGGYFIGPWIGWPILRRWGFRLTICTSLWVYACGTIILWPAAILASFVAFLISNLIVGSGLAILECAGDTFVAICGPMHYSEMRLSFAQGFRTVGSLVSFLLGHKVFFRDSGSAPLIRVQWAYLGITLFVVFLSVVYYYLPIPEASDDRLAQRANTVKIGKLPVVWVTFGAGVTTLFLAIGAQETGFTTSGINVLYRDSPLDDTDYVALGLGLLAASRFITTAALAIVKPRFVLLVLFLGVVTFSSLSMRLPGHAAAATGLTIAIFEGGIFSLLFAISLRGTGRHTKMAGCILVASISGGSVFVFIQRAASYSRGLQFSLIVTVVLYSTTTLFPIYLNLLPAARKQVDLDRRRDDSNEAS